MQVNVGTKVTQPMPNGLRWPAVAVSEPTSEKVTVINRTTKLPVEITVTRADFISLRQTREGEKYLAMTTEVIQYGYRPVAEPRHNTIPGLDADPETGEVLTVQNLLDLHGESYSTWQATQFEARRGATSAADL